MPLQYRLQYLLETLAAIEQQVEAAMVNTERRMALHNLLLAHPDFENDLHMLAAYAKAYTQEFQLK